MRLIMGPPKCVDYTSREAEGSSLCDNDLVGF